MAQRLYSRREPSKDRKDQGEKNVPKARLKHNQQVRTASGKVGKISTCVNPRKKSRGLRGERSNIVDKQDIENRTRRKSCGGNEINTDKSSQTKAYQKKNARKLTTRS